MFVHNQASLFACAPTAVQYVETMLIREPWDGRLRIAMPVVSGAIFANTLTVFLLAVLAVAGMDFYTNVETSGYEEGRLFGSGYLDRFDMRLRA
jgi:hypothetical protein